MIVLAGVLSKTRTVLLKNKLDTRGNSIKNPLFHNRPYYFLKENMHETYKHQISKQTIVDSLTIKKL